MHSVRGLLTGASAGSVNAIIAAINSCRPANYDPWSDLGWGIWVGLGFKDLFDAEQVGPSNVFTRDGLERAVRQVRRTWDEGLASDCDVVVGISATRLQSYPVALNEALSLPRQEEKFVIRVSFGLRAAATRLLPDGSRRPRYVGMRASHAA